MYGSFRAVGVGPAIDFGGRRLIVHARTVRDYAILESQAFSHRSNPSPLDRLRWLAANGCGEAVLDALWKKLRGGWWNVTATELLTWAKFTWEGRIWSLWLATQWAAPEISREWVEQELLAECDRRQGRGPHAEELWWSDLQESLDVANGEDELASLGCLFREASDGQAGINWPYVFRILGEEPFHKSISEIEGMTIAQVNWFWGKRELVGGGEGDEDQARGRWQQLQEIDRRAVTNFQQGKRWDSDE